MEIVINTDAPEPPFVQLITQIKEAVTDGALDPGDPLPSIRQLAGDLELNSKTVAKAYRLLDRDGVLQTRGYRGTFVHPEGRTNSSVDVHAWAQGRLRRTIIEFREAGVTDSEIRTAFSAAMSDHSK